MYMRHSLLLTTSYNLLDQAYKAEKEVYLSNLDIDSGNVEDVLVEARRPMCCSTSNGKTPSRTTIIVVDVRAFTVIEYGA